MGEKGPLNYVRNTETKKSKKFGHLVSRSGGEKPLNKVRNTETKKNLLMKAKFAHKPFFFVSLLFYTLY